jgi:hypothetical protein
VLRCIALAMPRSTSFRIHQPFEALLRRAPQGEGLSFSHRHGVVQGHAAAVGVDGLAGDVT